MAFGRLGAAGRGLGRLGAIGGGGGVVLAPVRLVATRGDVPDNRTQVTTEATRRKIYRTRHYVGGQNASEISLVFGGYYVSGGTNGELLPGNGHEVQASLEFPGGSPGVARFTFSGSQTATISDGLTELVSDPILPGAFGLSSFAAGTQFWIRHSQTVALNEWVLGSDNTGNVPAITGEGAAQCDAATDPQLDTTGTLSTTGSYTSYSVRKFPLAIIGRTAAPELAVGLFGDSILRKNSDTVGDGANGAGGYAQRALASVSSRHVPYSRLACVSESAQTQSGSLGDKRRALCKYVTHALVAVGTNDIVFGRTGAQVNGDLHTIWTKLKAAGVKRVEQVLLIPRCTSTDGFATVANQTPVSGFATGGHRDTVNNDIVASPGSNGLDDYITFNDILADGTSVDRWIANGTAGTYTTDGTHPLPASHGLVVSRVADRIATWTP